MKTPPNRTASESAPSKANSILSFGVDATKKPEPDHDSDQAALDLNSPSSIAMEPPTPTQQTASSAVTDLQALRLPAHYGATLGVKKLLTTVPVSKPKKPQFFRIHAAADELVEYLLVADEAQLTAPVRGTSEFAEVFAKQGPRDS